MKEASIHGFVGFLRTKSPMPNWKAALKPVNPDLTHTVTHLQTM